MYNIELIDQMSNEILFKSMIEYIKQAEIEKDPFDFRNFDGKRDFLIQEFTKRLKKIGFFK